MGLVTVNVEQPPQAVTPLWVAGFETGDESEWEQGGGGGYFNSGNWETNVVGSPAHSGAFANELIIRPNPAGSGIRAFRWNESRPGDDLYYSAWYYIPQQYTFSWWGLMQWKAVNNSINEPAWMILVNRNGVGGNMRFYVSNHWNGSTFTTNPPTFQQTINPTDVPVGQWFHMEAFLHQAKPSEWQAGNGSVLQIWINGNMIFDLGPGHLDNVNYPSVMETSDGRGQEWSIINYGGPNETITIYVDDVVIASERVWGKSVVGL